jgi:hypothetical protein
MIKKKLLGLEFFQLTDSDIKKSTNMSSWINQFSYDWQETVRKIIANLVFISESQLSRWIGSIIHNISQSDSIKIAVYSVRKISKEETSLWDKNGESVKRPAAGQGSEDLVSAAIRAISKPCDFIQNHPSIEELRREKIHHIVFVDDASISGKRMATYIGAFINSKTIRSWWSLNLIHFHIVATSISDIAMNRIYKSFPGSQKVIKTQKRKQLVHFHSVFFPTRTNYDHRWTPDYEKKIKFFKSFSEIPKQYRMGFGKVLSNVIFFNSVPNNIPGFLVKNTSTHEALFPDGAIPRWFHEVLNNSTVEGENDELNLEILLLLKHGIKRIETIGNKTARDTKLISKQLRMLHKAGMITDNNQITKLGTQYIHNKTDKSDQKKYNYSLYIPTKWCIDQADTQPSE